MKTSNKTLDNQDFATEVRSFTTFSKIENSIQDLVSDLVKLKQIKKGSIKDLESEFIMFFGKRDDEYFRIYELKNIKHGKAKISRLDKEYFRNFERARRLEFKYIYNFLLNNPGFDNPNSTNDLKLPVKAIPIVVQLIRYVFDIDILETYKSTFFKNISITVPYLQDKNSKFADSELKSVLSEILSELIIEIDKIRDLQNPDKIEAYYQQLSNPDFIYDKENNPSGISKTQFLKIAKFAADIKFNKINGNVNDKYLERLNKKINSIDGKVFSDAVVLCSNSDIVEKNI